MSKFQIFVGKDSQFYFRFNASNGEQILASEGYTTKDNCKNGIAAVKTLSPYDSSYKKSDEFRNYRFNMVATNGQIVAKSSEGYTTAQNRDHAIDIVKRDAKTSPTEDLT